MSPSASPEWPSSDTPWRRPVVSISSSSSESCEKGHMMQRVGKGRVRQHDRGSAGIARLREDSGGCAGVALEDGTCEGVIPTPRPSRIFAPAACSATASGHSSSKRYGRVTCTKRSEPSLRLPSSASADFVMLPLERARPADAARSSPSPPSRSSPSAASSSSPSSSPPAHTTSTRRTRAASTQQTRPQARRRRRCT
eukprot:962325-Pleurochrysis_carterae.AAC.1